MRWLIAAVLSLLAVAGCATVPRDYACGTDVLPPVAVDPIVCHNGYPGVRWYSAPRGAYQQAGLPMDEAWWYGGSGTIGYGRGYDPRPASYWQNDPRYVPYAAPIRQVPVQPPNAQTVVVNVKNTVKNTAPQDKAKPVSKAAADPPKAAPRQATKAAGPPAKPAPKAGGK